MAGVSYLANRRERPAMTTQDDMRKALERQKVEEATPRSNVIMATNFGTRRLTEAPAGAFVLFPTRTDDLGKPVGMHIRCPCHITENLECGCILTLRFKRDDKRGGWTWNGNEQLPTLDEPITCGRCENTFTLKNGAFVIQ